MEARIRTWMYTYMYPTKQTNHTFGDLNRKILYFLVINVKEIEQLFPDTIRIEVVRMISHIIQHINEKINSVFRNYEITSISYS